MERISALALCLLFSLCSATSPCPPKIPILTPLNCNETNSLVSLATDLINEDRERGFLIKPFRTRSFFEQKVEKVPGASLYYIDFDAKETGCSVLSGKKWKDCDIERSFHQKVSGECKIIMYISKPWRILKALSYNCTLGTVPSRTILSSCPDCPIIIRNISQSITAKAQQMVEKFNQESNQTNHFKLDEIERVSSQWVFGASYFISFIIKETDCLKTQKDVVLDKCKSLSDSKAHVGFCTGSAYNTPEKQEQFSVSCEIYDPRDDHHHHHDHGHGSCDHGKEGTQVEQSKDNVGHSEAGAEEVGPGEAGQGQSKDLPKKCELGKDKHCGQHKGHRHHCHPGHHHHHHHHHHPGHHHDHQNHSHPHDPAHHHHQHHHDHHNHTVDENSSSSSEENTNKQPYKRTKGSVQVYYLDEEILSPPVPTIVRQPGPSKHVSEVADFPNEASPLQTCPSEPY